MADKTVTVAVPEERVPEFYLWFAHFLASPAGTPPGPGPSGRGGPFGPRGRGFGRRGGGEEGTPWTAAMGGPYPAGGTRTGSPCPLLK